MVAVRALALVATVLSLATSVSAWAVSFQHGVASGDPLPTRMIIWTRVTPLDNQTDITVTWHVARQSNFQGAAALNGQVTTNASADFTVKHDVEGLEPGQKYFYKFTVSDGNSPETISASPSGRFKTPLPLKSGTKNQQLQYALFSCSNWPTGYFNAYNAASKLDLDFWVHLGDYIYEYGTDNPTPAKATRYAPEPEGLQPPHEIVTLDDYRKRHAHYRKDPGLQALSANAPLIAMWDDHEITNNARKLSGQNHQPATEGDYLTRVNVSIQAYHEWLPTRDHFLASGNYVGINYNRTIQFGDLASFIMTETRLTVRTDELTPPITAMVTDIVGNTNPDAWNATQLAALDQIKQYSLQVQFNESSEMLGPEQLAWMESEIEKSVAQGTTWQLFGFGTVMQDNSKQDIPTAIANKKKSNPALAQQWEDAWRAVAYSDGTPTTTKAYGLSCPELPYYGTKINVTEKMRASARANLAIGQRLIATGFDSWQGFQVEKQKYLAIAAKGSNVAQYGGDSHSDWVGIQLLNDKAVLGEFDVGGVSSTSYESGAVLPVDLLKEAMVAAANKTGLRRSYAGKKGFMLVTLTEDNHHIDYIHATSCTVEYKATCDFAYDWPTKENKKYNGDLHASKCTKGLKLQQEYLRPALNGQAQYSSYGL